MPFLTDQVAVRQVTDDDWKMLEPLRYEGNKETFEVPEGFITDFASVPRFFTWLVPRYGRYTRCAVLHDHLCREAHAGRFSRYDADGIFRQAMRLEGVGFVRRWLMWLAVRLGSGIKGLFERGFFRGLVTGLAAIAMILVFLIPIVVVLIWSLAYYVTEWVLYPFLKVGSRKKEVHKPKSVTGT